uniref:Uncharacterized protein n=1 Tax=Glossina pallidipes TaxID=7398 RepID=A0A1A9ZL41_GLOPL
MYDVFKWKPYRQHSDECSDSCEELSILGIHKFPSRDAEDILSVKSSLQFVVDVWHENADPTCKCNGPLSTDEYLGAAPMKPEKFAFMRNSKVGLVSLQYKDNYEYHPSLLK